MLLVYAGECSPAYTHIVIQILQGKRATACIIQVPIGINTHLRLTINLPTIHPRIPLRLKGLGNLRRVWAMVKGEIIGVGVLPIASSVHLSAVDAAEGSAAGFHKGHVQEAIQPWVNGFLYSFA